MQYVKADLLYDGVGVQRNVYVGFEGEAIRYVGKSRKDGGEVLGEGVVTPAFIDGHSHIGMARSGEPSREDEANEQMDSVYPLVNALHSVYMDDSAFRESVENGVLYSTVLPGSGNVIAGKGVLIRNFASNVRDAYLMDVGIKAALGYNPRSTTEWKGRRPTTRMGAVALLRENFIKAVKMRRLIEKEKKLPEEVEPLTEIFMDILSGKYKMMVHLHKEDDAMVLLSLVEEFGFKAVLNHGLDIYREEVFRAVKHAGVPLVYGPMDSFPYKVELKHESWRNAKVVLASGIKFCMMSDHPVLLQRNMFYTLRHFMRFGLKREHAISKLTKEAAEIIGAKDLGQVRGGYKASLVVWSGDPFNVESYPKLVVGEGRIVHQE
ncbi:imidazolonepropionase [Candidatus Marsarchaeota G2 archaeon BE_D]|jgi:Imidazolonepropionase and related amidohydrolases|uniref:Imidazolonepropionase n=1 Tax=Candidatus Marsarchaeota G2 archaeon BE_D TaxID=1978158 RepID=A0A2R6C654_9ARCH|nr:MAG: imidazolonepropionase [Candidatus Marsarchaeota G2 archaeon BE_D]